MPTEIEQIEDLIITEIKRASERTTNNVVYPVIGISDCETWSGGDIEEMLREVNSETAARVIYAGSKQGDIKVIGGGAAHDENIRFRVALVVTNLRSQAEGSRGGYVYIEAMKLCFARFMLTPLRGFLKNTEDNLLYVEGGKHVYGFELERSIGK
jgi:hypothetical protein